MRPSPEELRCVEPPIIGDLKKNGVRRKKNDPFQIRFAHVRDEAPIAAVEREGSKAKFEQVFSDFGA